jgi:hypothetical protein
VVKEGGYGGKWVHQPEEAPITETGHDIPSGSSRRQAGWHLTLNYKVGLRGTDREMYPLGILLEQAIISVMNSLNRKRLDPDHG